MENQPSRIVVAITGASGAILGVRVLERLAARVEVETHLVISRAGALTLSQETDRTVTELADLADVVHPANNIGATIASGSFHTDGMIVAPCSMRTVGAIANSLADNLVVRAADVTLKEGRPLLLMVREAPLHLGHLRLLTMAAEAGAVIAPPVPAFYQRPESLDEAVDHMVDRALDRIRPGLGSAQPWNGLRGADQ